MFEVVFGVFRGRVDSAETLGEEGLCFRESADGNLS
jgi:hypothetical protein